MCIKTHISNKCFNFLPIGTQCAGVLKAVVFKLEADEIYDQIFLFIVDTQKFFDELTSNLRTILTYLLWCYAY